jgi:membrane glycosyltransferase
MQQGTTIMSNQTDGPLQVQRLTQTDTDLHLEYSQLAKTGNCNKSLYVGSDLFAGKVFVAEYSGHLHLLDPATGAFQLFYRHCS